MVGNQVRFRGHSDEQPIFGDFELLEVQTSPLRQDNGDHRQVSFTVGQSHELGEIILKEFLWETRFIGHDRQCCDSGLSLWPFLEVSSPANHSLIQQSACRSAFKGTINYQWIRDRMNDGQQRKVKTFSQKREASSDYCILPAALLQHH